MTQFDLVIRNGLVLDGSGGEGRHGSVAVRDGVVAAVGDVEGSATRTIDADGAVVAPGFVDIHTHYDGQATWDEHLAPSAWHGVTTIVMGNCGVGFAPVRPSDRDRLIELMEGVEDIPGAALHEGLSWRWESFAEYLDEIERRPHDIDVGAQVPHGALRLYVMGERGANREPATADEIEEMGRLAAEAIEAGALGFTTSRTINHRTSRGEPTPTLTAARDELVGIARRIGATNKGVLQVVSDLVDFDDELTTFRTMVEASGRPLSLSLAQHERRPLQYRRLLDAFAEANAEGLEMRAQVAVRAIGILIGLQGSVNPLAKTPTYRSLHPAGDPDRTLPLDELVVQLRRPEIREAIVGEVRAKVRPDAPATDPSRIYVLGEQPNYEPDPATSVAAMAARRGVDALELLYDLFLEQEGRALLYIPVLNYVDGNLDAVGEMLSHPNAVPGLSDGGAHVGTICDGSFPTSLLTHWGRDRSRGAKFELAWLISRQSRATAEAVGLRDRGLLEPGLRADINVIDVDALTLHSPELSFDLPAGGKRLLQRVDGYRHTFVAGVETYADGEPTGELPGRLVRGARS
jgi:N-acyl-D-aspartate/D-glutamate deacylase